jgi:hypothetical protein
LPHFSKRWNLPGKPVGFSDSRWNEVFALHAGSGVPVRILKELDPKTFRPFNISQLYVGQVYLVGQGLAELLILEGYAEPETPALDHAADRAARKSKR